MERTDYNAAFERLTAGLTTKPRLLLHVCCAPCMSAAIGRLCAHFAVTVYFYNPNICPEAEYAKRLGEVRRLLKEAGYDVPVLAEPYDRAAYDAAVGELKGSAEGGAKCERCCYARLERTAAKAAAEGYEYFTTTLTSGPLKNAALLNGMMAELAAKYGVACLPSDFKKKGGNLLIKDMCAKYGVYRQHYCGCTPPRLVAAVTGGIAAGKSTLVGIFARLGAYTIAADKITRELQAEGTAVNAAIKSAFPQAVKGGRLDRAALKSEVFADPARLAKLESIVHPAVKAEIVRRIAAADAAVVVVEVPLLFESGMAPVADVTVNVEMPPEVRKARAMARDGMTAAAFDAVAGAQLSDEERRARADVTVRGDDLKSLEKSAEELMRQWQDKLKQA